MKKLSLLKQEHRKIDAEVTKLEKERAVNRDFNHKVRLQQLKKKRLLIRTQINENLQDASMRGPGLRSSA